MTIMMVEEAMLIVEEDDLHTMHLLLFDKVAKKNIYIQ